MAKNQKGAGTSCDVGLLADGNVILQFGDAIRHMTFTPEQAVNIGTALIKYGAHGESIQRVAPPGKTAPMPGRKQ